MSTIFGIFNRKKKIVENRTLQKIDSALAYWDCDDNGIWKSDCVALGHRMLWSTPESKLEYLPSVIHPQNQTFVITIDARLDNRETLAEQLELSTHLLSKTTDSELILAAYRKWGENCPKYLLGDFVFAIWDAAKEQLFCARDHMGIKPFYYYLSDDLFIFSNDIRGVIAHPEVSEKYNDRSIAMFLAGDFGFYDKKDTLFSDIQKLEAATSITITQNTSLESAYWNIEDIPKVQYATYEEYVEKLRALLSDAVRVRLRTAYPAASHLSGGLDSSAIAVLAARELHKRDKILYSFNWIETQKRNNDSIYPEWDFAAQLADLENIEQKHIKLTPEYIAEMFDKVDVSTDDVTLFWGEYLVRNEAEKYEVRTILSGWGGDDLISYDGYAYLSGLFRQGRFMKAIKELSILYKDKNYKYLRIIKRSVRELIYPLFYKRMSGFYQEGKTNSDSYQFTQKQFSSLAKGYAFADVIFHPGVHNEQKYLVTSGHILQRIENWASSAIEKRLEYSYPLLDKRIVELALAVPEDLFGQKEGHQRYFFRRAISDFLPDNIAWERKIGESEHGKQMQKLWYEALKLWMQKNEKILNNRNCYVDRSKIIDRLKIYLENEQNGIEDEMGSAGLVASILLSNLEDRDC